MFVPRDRADVAMQLARTFLRCSDNHRFAGSRARHVGDLPTGTEGTCHGRLRKASTLRALILGLQERQIVAIAPEFGTDHVEIFTGPCLIFVAID